MVNDQVPADRNDVHNISAAGAVDREFDIGFFWFNLLFFLWVLGSVRCRSGEISKFCFRWAPGEPEMILKCPDQAPGQLRIFLSTIT